MSDQPGEVKKGVSAKNSSLGGQIFGAVWIGAGTIAKGAGLLNLEVWEIIVSGLAIAACFTAIYFNLLMDKIKEIKLGGKG